MTSLVVGLLVVAIGACGCSSSGNKTDASGGVGGTSGTTTADEGGATSGGTAAGGAAACSLPTTKADVAASGCLDGIAWYRGNIESVSGTGKYYATSPGQKTANAWGLYDMLGNAVEWTEDCEHDTYAGAPSDGSAWTSNCVDVSMYMIRGGCSSADATLARASYREAVDPTGYGGCMVGFRCAADADANLTDGGKFTWVDVPIGAFAMGCSSGDGDCTDREMPAHCVTLKAFKLMAKEVTQQEYYDVMGAWTFDLLHHCPECSNTEVEYSKAQNFCQNLGGRLPSEAEWEYAARAGTTTRYYCGD